MAHGKLNGGSSRAGRRFGRAPLALRARPSCAYCTFSSVTAVPVALTMSMLPPSPSVS